MHPASDTITRPLRPTAEQRAWLARVLGRAAWEELVRLPEFQSALETSLPEAHRLGLKFLASKAVNDSVLRSVAGRDAAGW
jgi:hypothetical protein